MNMKISKKIKKAGIMVATLCIVLAISLGIFGTELLKPGTAQNDFPLEHLFVDATYLLKTDETNETVNVTCTLYLTNIWEKESGDIKVIAYVIETSNNLAVYKNTVEIGKIAANSTAEIELPVALSNNSYKVDILIFENGKLVIKGQLTISAYPVYLWDEVDHVGKQVWNILNSTGDFRQIH